MLNGYHDLTVFYLLELLKPYKILFLFQLFLPLNIKLLKHLGIAEFVTETYSLRVSVLSTKGFIKEYLTYQAPSWLL